MEKIEDAKMRFEVLKDNFEYQNYFSQFLEWDKNSPKGVWPGLGFNKFGLLGLRYLLPSPAYKQEDLYELISPWSEIEPFPEKILKSILPRLFYDPAVKMIEVKGKRNFDFEDASTFKSACTDIDIVFLLRPPHISNKRKYFRPLFDAMNERGVKKVVFLSVQGAETSDIIPHRKTEKMILAYGFEYFFSRPGYFMQNLTTTVLLSA